jgi:hypothetical protein
MERNDRFANLGIFGAAAVTWLLVLLIVTTRDPIVDPVAGFIGAAVIGAAIGLTTIPVFWLVVFGRHRGITYRGDWMRAIRRGSWVGLVIAIFIVLRLQGALELPIALFILVLVFIAEATLSVDR